MKYLIINILLIFSINISAQEEDFFQLSNSKITWQKVYETPKTKAQLLTYFEDYKKFTAVRVVADTIFAKLKPQAIDVNVFGTVGVPPLVNKSKYKGYVRIEIRDKRYRVTFNHLKLVGDGEIIKKNDEQTFEENFVRKDVSEYRPFFTKKPRDVYNHFFNTVFEIKVKKKDEW